MNMPCSHAATSGRNIGPPDRAATSAATSGRRIGPPRARPVRDRIAQPRPATRVAPRSTDAACPKPCRSSNQPGSPSGPCAESRNTPSATPRRWQAPRRTACPRANQCHIQKPAHPSRIPAPPRQSPQIQRRKTPPKSDHRTHRKPPTVCESECRAKAKRHPRRESTSVRISVRPGLCLGRQTGMRRIVKPWRSACSAQRSFMVRSEFAVRRLSMLSIPTLNLT